MDSQPGPTHIRSNILAIVLVLALSFVLLCYVGIGEARRTYPRFVMDRLAAQGELVENAIKPFLLAGLPLEQFPGFTTVTEPILRSDRSIVAIDVTDPADKVVFSNAQPHAAPPTDPFAPSPLQPDGGRYTIGENAAFYQITLELKNKFETVGNLHMTLPRSVIADKIDADFFDVAIAALVVLLLYALFLLLAARRWATGDGTRWLGVSYGVAFFAMAAVVIGTLINIYGAGIQGKTAALADTLGHRLNAPLELGLTLDSLEGVQDEFNHYRELNPDLSFITLTSGDTIAIDTDPALVGSRWTAHPDSYEYDVTLERQPATSPTLAIHMGIPKDIVYGKLWRSAKNFLVLFIASGFLATIFFNLIGALTGRQRGSGAQPSHSGLALSLITPLYFLGVFADSMTNSFLPQFFRERAQSANVAPSITSTLFTIYFASYALALLPAGRFVERRGVKPLLIAGALLTGTELLILAFAPDFYALFVVQALAGFGQGLLFIGVQSYILTMASSGERTRGAAMIVFGYNGGVLSGMSIGGLLAADPALGRQGVFVVAGTIALLVLLYAALFIPRAGRKAAEDERPSGAAPAAGGPGFWRNLGRAIKDFEFVKATFLVGIPTKIIMAGLISATLPLLLARQHYATEDIGQMIMLYSAGVLISSRYVSPLADRIGKTTGILAIGIVGSGLGLILIGLMDWSGLAGSLPYMATIVLIGGITTLGLSHGFIQAPIITHVSNSGAAGALGKATTTSLYRLLERIGNIGGPIIVSQLLLHNGDQVFTVSWIGIAMLVFGVLFFIGPGFSRTALPSQS